ncbi:hypothetical protein ACSS6W_005922 [Trichoderma asperelloides]
MQPFRTSSRALRIPRKSLMRAASSAARLDHQPSVNSSQLHALKVISPDSGMPTTISPLFNPNIVGRVPPESNRPEIQVPTDRGCFADPEKKALFSVAEPHDWTISLGTELKGCQLSQLNHQQLDELALLIAERGVVFLRDQDITAEQQVAMFKYFDETMCDMWHQTPNRPPLDTHHPAVITHPVTGLKALNVNIGWCDGFAELNKAESDALMNFFRWHIHSADDHYVRLKWAPGTVAIWDNRKRTRDRLTPAFRAVLHRIIPTAYRGQPRTGVRTVTIGSKPKFDPASIGRRQKEGLRKL